MSRPAFLPHDLHLGLPNLTSRWETLVRRSFVLDEAPSSAPCQGGSGRRMNWLSRAILRRSSNRAVERAREKLAQYDDRLLDDIGLTREQTLGTQTRPAWADVNWLTMTRAR